MVTLFLEQFQSKQKPHCDHSQKGKQNIVIETGLDMWRGVACFFIVRVQGAEACPEPNIYDSFFIK